MNELRNSKSDDQLEELLLLTEQMQEELDQKDRTIRELKMQLDESLTLNERLNSENRAGNIQALKNDLRKTKELLQSEKEKTHAAEIMTEECQDKLRQAEQERDYALSHQKKVEIPVEKPVLYQKCGNCNQTAYLRAKERYDTQREKLAGRYKAKTAMYEALMFAMVLSCLTILNVFTIPVMAAEPAASETEEIMVASVPSDAKYAGTIYRNGGTVSLGSVTLINNSKLYVYLPKNNNLDLYQGTITFRSGLNVVTKQLANYSTDTWIYTADDIGSGTWTVTVSGYAVGTTQNVKYGIKREIEI